MKNIPFLLILLLTFSIGEEIDLSNYQKYSTNFSYSIIGKNQISTNDEYNNFNLMALFSWNSYELDGNGEKRVPNYFRLLISNQYDQYQFESFFLQTQGSRRKNNGNKHFNISMHILLENKYYSDSKKYGFGFGYYHNWERKFDNNKAFTFDIAANIFPLTFEFSRKQDNIVQTATLIPQFAFELKKFQLTLELFTYVTYKNKGINYYFRPALLFGMNGFSFW